MAEPYSSYGQKTVGELKELIRNTVKSGRFGDWTVISKSFSLDDFVNHFKEDDYVMRSGGVNTIIIRSIHPELCYAYVTFNMYSKTTFQSFLHDGIFETPDKIVWQSDLDARLSSLEQRISGLESK